MTSPCSSPLWTFAKRRANAPKVELVREKPSHLAHKAATAPCSVSTGNVWASIAPWRSKCKSPCSAAKLARARLRPSRFGALQGRFGLGKSLLPCRHPAPETLGTVPFDLGRLWVFQVLPERFKVFHERFDHLGASLSRLCFGAYAQPSGTAETGWVGSLHFRALVTWPMVQDTRRGREPTPLWSRKPDVLPAGPRSPHCRARTSNGFLSLPVNCGPASATLISCARLEGATRTPKHVRSAARDNRWGTRPATPPDGAAEKWGVPTPHPGPPTDEASGWAPRLRPGKAALWPAWGVVCAAQIPVGRTSALSRNFGWRHEGCDRGVHA